MNDDSQDSGYTEKIINNEIDFFCNKCNSQLVLLGILIPDCYCPARCNICQTVYMVSEKNPNPHPAEKDKIIQMLLDSSCKLEKLIEEIKKDGEIFE